MTCGRRRVTPTALHPGCHLVAGGEVRVRSQRDPSVPRLGGYCRPRRRLRSAWCRGVGVGHRGSRRPAALHGGCRGQPSADLVTRSGILKAEAVERAASAMDALGVRTAAQFRTSYHDRAVEAAWPAVKGQSSGISWHYVRILAGVDDVKADRMICAFVHSATGRAVDPPAARCLVIVAHRRLRSQHPDLDLRTLDHAIWTHQRQLA